MYAFHNSIYTYVVMLIKEYAEENHICKHYRIYDMNNTRYIYEAISFYILGGFIKHKFIFWLFKMEFHAILIIFDLV